MLNSPWRKTAATIYQKPRDSKIIGSVELDITVLNAFIQQQRQAGLKVTLTHVITLATARAMATELPALNTYIRRGNVVSHPQIDATISVLLKNAQMGTIRLEHADQLTLAEAVAAMTDKVKIARTTKDGSQELKTMLARIPWPFRQWMYQLLYTLTVRWGFNLPGLTAHRFGSFVVSNIGSLGLDIGYPALLPAANISFVLILGGHQEKPCVVDGQIVPRTLLKLGIAMDHRLLDAAQGGELFRYLKQVVRWPEVLLEQLPAKAPSASSS
ncbi:MAG: dehydrogenase [Bacteroidetes bacterium]|nr:MAG: dehydrogenase [Bacteroidota bacterium]PTM12380.1 MAG: dehydrogenase [Bacteroidota bacterium]